MVLPVTKKAMSRIALLGLALLAMPCVPVEAAPPPEGWRIRFEALAQSGLVDMGRLRLGAAAAASTGFDAFDDPHPPALPSRFLDLVTRHAQTDSGWQNQPRGVMAYRGEYIAPVGSGNHTIDFFLETDRTGNMTMAWLIELSNTELAQHSLTLRDVDGNATVDLRAQGAYVFSMAAPGVRHFQLEMGAGVNAPPVANSQSLSTDEDAQLPITLTANDPENASLTYRIVTPASHGALADVPPNIRYVPDANYFGPDSFQFVANDGQLDSNVASVSVTVDEVNDAPATVTLQAETNEDVPVTITLLAPDIDGDPLQYHVLSNPAHGTLNPPAPAVTSAVTYTPAPDFDGTDSFTFRAYDGLAYSGVSTVQITVHAVADPPGASFTVRGPEHRASSWRNNLGALIEGAAVVGYSTQSSSYPASNALDDKPDTSWVTATNAITDQYLIVSLAGTGPRTIDRVRLLNSQYGQSVKDFEVAVSTTTPEAGSFTTVLVDRALENALLQEFRLPTPAPARFVRLRILNNHGSPTNITLASFEIVDSTLPGIPSHLRLPANAALPSEGGSVTATSESGNAPASAVTDGSASSAWSSANGQTANQSLTVELLRTFTVDRVRLIGSLETTSVRDFTVEVSPTLDPAGFAPVISAVALNTTTLQEFVFPAGPRPARLVRLKVTTNYGSTSAVSLNELQVMAVAASTASFSSHEVGHRPELMLINNGLGWLSADGRVTDEFVKIRLAANSLIDRVRIQPTSANPSQESVRDFEVWVSTTTDEDAAFTRVLEATAQDGGVRQEFTFPGGPVRATYVKLVARNNYGGASIRITSFEVLNASSEGNIISLPGAALNSLRPESPSLIVNGAVVVAYSSASGFGHDPAAMLNYTTQYWGTDGVANQFAVIQLAGGRVYSLEGIRLTPTANSDSVKDFEIWVSTTTADPSAFVPVLQGSVAMNGLIQTFLIPGGPVPARYIRYVPLNNYGHPDTITTDDFDVIVPNAGGVVASTNALVSSARPELAIDGNTVSVWRTNGLTNRWVKVRLSGGEVRPIAGVAILPYGTQGPRDFQIRVSTTTDDDAAFTTVHTGMLPESAARQEIRFAAPVNARYVQFYWLTGWYPPSNFIGVVELEILDDLNSPYSLVLDASSQPGPAVGALDIDPGVGLWQTQSGQATNQWMKIKLPHGASWTVDQIVLKPKGVVGDEASVRRFELQVSDTTPDDAAFATVLQGTLRNDATFQHFYFPPVQARYVRFVALNNYGGASVALQVLWLISPQVGSTDARFLDLSVKGDAAITGYAWDFGDNATSSARDPQHTYAAAGEYDVRLTVTDAAGSTGEHTIRYHAAAPPQPDFTWAPVGPGEGGSVLFTDVSQIPIGATAFREWRFGDGSEPIVGSVHPAHIFNDDGSYSVTLRIAGETGLYREVTKTVTVMNLTPTVDAGPDLTLLWGRNWNVGAVASDPGPDDRRTIQCRWQFGDGTPDVVFPCWAGAFAPHSFANPGVFTATLTVTDSDGATASDSLVVTVTKHRTSLVACGPQLGITGTQADVEATAKLIDLEEPTRQLAGYTIVLTVGAQTVTLTTDALGVVRLPFSLLAGQEVAIHAEFGGDGWLLPSIGDSNAKVVTVVRPMRADSEGTEFRLAFPENLGALQLSFSVTGDTTTTGRVTLPSVGLCASFTVIPGTATVVSVPGAAAQAGTDSIERKGIHLTALDEVAVSGLAHVASASDAYLGLPTDVLGTEHIVLGYPRQAQGIQTGSQFTIVAAGPGVTTVTVTPKAAIPSRPAGQPFSISLNQGETYQYRTETYYADVTGTVISSDKGVAVFGGEVCAYVPISVYTPACNHLVEQIPPTAVWGRRFLSVPLATRTGGDTFRFLASEDGTSVSVNGGAVATLGKGQFHEMLLPIASEITADHPILVAQYSNGRGFDQVLIADPFMMLIPPVDHYLDAYTVSTPVDGFRANFINLVVRTLSMESVRLDGQTVPETSFTPIGSTGFSAAKLAASLGPHRLTASTPFGATVYGYDDADAYGYPAGVSFAPLPSNAPPVAANQTATTVEDTAKPITLTATDAEGDPLTFTIVTGPAHGTLTGTAPNVIYTPAADYNGPDSFRFKANDTHADSNVATVSITTTPVNDAPVAHDAEYTTARNTPVAITLVATDVDGDTLIYIQPDYPGISGTPPNLLYTPPPNFGGVVHMDFQVRDAQLFSNFGQLTVTITPLNYPPVVTDQSMTTAEDTPNTITLTGTDPDGDPIEFWVGWASHGSVGGILPSVTYTPNANYVGSDLVYFYAYDDTGHYSNVAALTITVTPVNDAPVAASQSVNAVEDIAAAITLTATDIEGTPLTYTIVSSPTHGTVTSGTGPGRTYMPAADYAGPDSFTFTANDGQLDSNLATVSVTVAGVNDAPVASAQSVTIDEDAVTAITLAATDVDGNPLVYAIASGPTHGTLSGGTGSNRTYTPATNYNGIDSFSFKAHDGLVYSNVATVSVTINAVNDPPVANAQSPTANEDTATLITLAATDVDGNPLTYTVTQPAHGTVTTGTAATRTYTPVANYNGPDNFTFTATDGTVTSNIATVSIDVTAVNDAPVAAGQAPTTAEDTAIPITLTATDVDGTPLTYEIVANPTHGALSGTAPNVTYTPAANYNGTDNFTFRAYDGSAYSNVPTISLTITAVNDPPVASPQSVSTPKNTAKAITLVAVDPVEGNPLTYSIVAQPTHGTVTAGATAARTYTPTTNYTGPDNFTFKANDGTDSNIATVTITVTVPNSAPVATPQSGVTTAEDTPKAITLAATDANGDPLTYQIVAQPAHGSVTAGTTAARTYTPAANYVGTDNFTFKANDGQADSNVAMVSLSMTAVNDAPVASDQSVTTTKNIAKAITLSATDVEGSTLTYTIVTQPAHGTVSTGTAAARTYTPTTNYIGPDGFTFKASDGSLFSNTATVSITVNGTPPVCTAATRTPSSLWPADNTMRTIAIAGVTGDGTITITSQTIRQDEALTGAGTGTLSPDGTLSPLTVRAERSTSGNGRVYTITFQATSTYGSCTGSVTVCAPIVSGGTCTNGGTLFDSTVQ